VCRSPRVFVWVGVWVGYYFIKREGAPKPLFNELGVKLEDIEPIVLTRNSSRK